MDARSDLRPVLAVLDQAEAAGGRDACDDARAFAGIGGRVLDADIAPDGAAERAVTDGPGIRGIRVHHAHDAADGHIDGRSREGLAAEGGLDVDVLEHGIVGIGGDRGNGDVRGVQFLRGEVHGAAGEIDVADDGVRGGPEEARHLLVVGFMDQGQTFDRMALPVEYAGKGHRGDDLGAVRKGAAGESDDGPCHAGKVDILQEDHGAGSILVAGHVAAGVGPYGPGDQLGGVFDPMVAVHGLRGIRLGTAPAGDQARGIRIPVGIQGAEDDLLRDGAEPGGSLGVQGAVAHVGIEPLPVEQQVVHAGLEVGPVPVGMVVVRMIQVREAAFTGLLEGKADGREPGVQFVAQIGGSLDVGIVKGLETAESLVILVAVRPCAFKDQPDAGRILPDLVEKLLGLGINRRVGAGVIEIIGMLHGRILEQGIRVPSLPDDILGQFKMLEITEILASLHESAQLDVVSLAAGEFFQHVNGAVVVSERVAQDQHPPGILDGNGLVRPDVGGDPGGIHQPYVRRGVGRERTAIPGDGRRDPAAHHEIPALDGMLQGEGLDEGGVFGRAEILHGERILLVRSGDRIEIILH